jgi:hypothetical protein
MAKDTIRHLNRAKGGPMVNRLRMAIAESKQTKAPPAQWASWISALSQKGIKASEIEDSSIKSWLKEQDPQQTVTKDMLLKALDSRLWTLKEVLLGNPAYSGFQQGGGVYQEYLYIAASENEALRDMLEEVEYFMNELAFDVELLGDAPNKAILLEGQRAEIMTRMKTAFNGHYAHFGAAIDKYGKNILAHCRVQQYPVQGVYFIEEIQSDWAQGGRKDDWQFISKGPLVTNTEAWAGMVLRRQLALAAQDPTFTQFSWITETMRNGGRQNLVREQAKRDYRDALAAEEKRVLAELPTDSPSRKSAMVTATANLRAMGIVPAGLEGHDRGIGDDLNEFYLKVILKMVNKLVAGTGEEVQHIRCLIGSAEATVPSLMLTDKVRAKLLESQPVYSRASLQSPRPSKPFDPVLEDIMANASVALGSPKHLRFVKHLYDTSTGREVAGKYVNGVIQVSLSARDIDEVANHECFHLAQERLLTLRELELLDDAFAKNSELNKKVRLLLSERGDYALAFDCANPRECAAQAYAMWLKGTLDLDERDPVRGIFSELADMIQQVVTWVREQVLLQELHTPEDVFSAFATGEIAARHKQWRSTESIRAMDVPRPSA